MNKPKYRSVGVTEQSPYFRQYAEFVLIQLYGAVQKPIEPESQTLNFLLLLVFKRF